MTRDETQNPRRCQCAQRMGKIVVNEAWQEADRLTTQAQQTAAVCPSWPKSQARVMSRRWRRRFWSLYKI